MAKLASSKVASLTATIGASDRAKKRGGASVAWQHFLRGCMAARHPGASTCTLLPADTAASAVLAELLGVRVGMP